MNVVNDKVTWILEQPYDVNLYNAENIIRGNLIIAAKGLESRIILKQDFLICFVSTVDKLKITQRWISNS